MPDRRVTVVNIDELPDTIGLSHHIYDRDIGDILSSSAFYSYDQRDYHDGVFKETSINSPLHYNAFICEMVDFYNGKYSYRNTVMALSQLGTSIIQHKRHEDYQSIATWRSSALRNDARRGVERFSGRKTELFDYARGNTERIPVIMHVNTVSAPLGLYSQYFRMTKGAIMTCAIGEAILTWDELPSYPNAEEMFLLDVTLFDNHLNQLIQSYQPDIIT